jgi:Protein of unknown function (DUF4242)
MPIFMDRHDLRGATAAQVAEAHRRDIDVQERYGVKYMAYWFDEHNGSGFCLVHAPDAAAAERVHREAHGQIANAIVPVDLSRLKRFSGASVTRARLPGPPRRPSMPAFAQSCSPTSLVRPR